LKRRGHGAEGAVLVRPDRFVAWRAMTLAEDPKAALGAALDRILACG
jgi:2,4-dichlorophenol 6-monooxygenase